MEIFAQQNMVRVTWVFVDRSRMVEEERYLDEKEGIRQRSTDRRAERKAKSDEIKRKYGE